MHSCSDTDLDPFSSRGGVLGMNRTLSDMRVLFFFSRIMVLGKGFMMEFDTPQALLAQQGIFYKMARDAGLA